MKEYQTASPAGQKKEAKGNGKLRRQQQIGQQFIVEYRLALHVASTKMMGPP